MLLDKFKLQSKFFLRRTAFRSITLQALLFGMLLPCVAPSADILVTFDNGFEGWTATGGIFTHQSTGGNPGGFVALRDNQSDWMQVYAPSTILGDWSSYLGGTIAFDARNINGASPNLTTTPLFGTITISSASATASRVIAGTGNPPADGQWHTFSATLLPEFWNGNLTDALSNVLQVRVVLESNSSPTGEHNGFDNFRLTRVPGPTHLVSSYVNHTSYIGTGSSLDLSKVLVKESNAPHQLIYDNLINTAQGINGIVFDIENLPDAGNLSVEDFEFQVSPPGAFVAGDHPPANWQAAPNPSSITVTPGTPDRVLIQWPDQSIMNRWLRITVKATPNTGLAAPETYYIGHLLGETTGPDNGMFTVSFADITPIRAEVGQTVDASSITDIDKNGTVSFADISAMRGNVGAQLTQISVP